MSFDIPSDSLMVLDQCKKCNRWAFRSKDMDNCLCCDFPSRIQRRSNGICSHPVCNERLLRKFTIEVGIGFDEEPGIATEILTEAVNTIVHSIFMIHGPMCETHLRAKFGLFLEPIPDCPDGQSAFHYMLKQFDSDRLGKIMKDFQEEWE